MSTTTNTAAIPVPAAPKTPSPTSSGSSSPNSVSSIKGDALTASILTFDIDANSGVTYHELTPAAAAPPSPSILAAKAILAKISPLNLTIKTIVTIVRNLLPACAAPFVDLFDKKPGQLKATVKGAFPLPGNSSTSLTVDAQTQVQNRTCLTNAELTLSNNVTCTIRLEVPEAAENYEPSVKLHSRVVTQLKQLLEKQKSALGEANLEINEVLNLIAKLPAKDVRVDWNGESGCAILYVNLPGEAKLTIFLQSPTDYGQTFDNLPDFIRQLLFVNLKEIYPVIKPLLKQNFIFRWDGAKSEFTFEFTSGARNVVLKELELEGKGFIGKLARWLTRGTKVRLPQAIKGKVNFETLSLEFEHKVSTNAQFEKGLTITVTPNSRVFGSFNVSIGKVSFNSETHAVTLDYKAIKKSGTKVIPLTSSGSPTLKKIDFDINSAEGPQSTPAASSVPDSNATLLSPFMIFEQYFDGDATPIQQPGSLTERKLIQIPSLDFTIGTIINVVKNILPASLSPFVDLFHKSGSILTQLEGEIPLVQKPWEGETLLEESIYTSLLKVGVNSSIQEEIGNTTALTLALPGNVSCDFILTIPRSASGERRAPKELHPFIIDTLQQKLLAFHKTLCQKIPSEPEVQKTFFENANIELSEVVNLIKQLPTQDIKVSWDGKTGNATLSLTLPGGAQLKIYIKSPTDYGQAFDKLPSFIREVLAAQLKGIYPVVRPLLTQTFNFQWNGASSEFELKFESPQKVLIKTLVLKAKGALAAIAEKIAKDTKIRLPRKIIGKVNFKDLSLRLFGSKLDDKTGEKMDDKLTIEVDTPGVPNFDISLPSVSFDPKPNVVTVNYDTLFKKGSEKIDLNTSNLEAIDLEIGPVNGSPTPAQPKNSSSKPAAPATAPVTAKPAATPASKAPAKPAAKK